jgi:acetyltransferase-like isoleucine patch superfamily enzyme
MIIKLINKYIEKRKLNKIIFGKFDNNITISKNYKFLFSKNIFISEHVYIGPNATIYAHDNVTISRGTIIGPHITIYTANHNFNNADSIPYDKKLNKKAVIIKENVWIGGNVILLPGTIINEGCIIGAGAVIAKEIPKYSIVIGNPSKIIGKRNIEEYEKLKAEDKIYLKKDLG